MQNAAATPAYVQRIEAGQLAGARGHMMTGEDMLRARAIEMLMCDFRLDLAALHEAHSAGADWLRPEMTLIAKQFGDLVEVTSDTVAIRPAGRALTRIIASRFDSHVPEGARYSQAS